MPSSTVMHNRLHVRKARKLALPLAPTDMDFAVPDQLRGHLLADSREEDSSEPLADRILIFGDKSASEWMYLVESIHADGTFSVVPKLRRVANETTKRRRILPETIDQTLATSTPADAATTTNTLRKPQFVQLYLILAVRKGINSSFTFPILHCLLQRKDAQTYTRMWRLVCSVSY